MLAGGTVRGRGQRGEYINVFKYLLTIYCIYVQVVERNEMYGEPTDYYQYDKDAYDTRVVDTNYMYDDDETGMYE